LKQAFITPDLTPKEQEENQKLRKRLAEMNSSSKIYCIKKQTDYEEGGYLTSSSPASVTLAQTVYTSDSNFLVTTADLPTFKIISSNFCGLPLKKSSF